MVVVATSKVVLIEFPAELSEEVSAGEDAFPAFSKNMHDLLSDHNIVKVFCDGSGIQQNTIIGSKDISRIPKMETRCVERMCKEEMNYNRLEPAATASNGSRHFQQQDNEGEGGLPLSKVLEYCTEQFYPGMCIFICVFLYLLLTVQPPCTYIYTCTYILKYHFLLYTFDMYIRVCMYIK